MAWLKILAAITVFGIAVVVGGAGVRLAALAGDIAVVVVTGVLVGLLVVVGLIAAKSRRWLANPYW